MFWHKCYSKFCLTLWNSTTVIAIQYSIISFQKVKHPVDDTADASDYENGAFIYPDLETALVGRFNVADNTLLEALEATVGSVNVNSFGIMEPIFDKVKSQLGEKYLLHTVHAPLKTEVTIRKFYFWPSKYHMKME